MAPLLWHILIVLTLLLAAGRGLVTLRAGAAVWLLITIVQLAMADWMAAPQLLTVFLCYLCCVGRAARASYFAQVNGVSARPRPRARATAPVGTISMKGVALGLALAALAALGALLFPPRHESPSSASQPTVATSGTILPQPSVATADPAPSAPAPPVPAHHTGKRHHHSGHGSRSAWHDMRSCLGAGSDADVVRCSEGSSR
jgi:hypothetical protein